MVTTGVFYMLNLKIVHETLNLIVIIILYEADKTHCKYDFPDIILLLQGRRERSPHTNKLRTRVTNICGNRRRQPSRSAMEGPPPGETSLMIKVIPVPGKYDFTLIILPPDYIIV